MGSSNCNGHFLFFSFLQKLSISLVFDTYDIFHTFLTHFLHLCLSCLLWQDNPVLQASGAQKPLPHCQLSDVHVTERGGTESEGEYFDMDIEGSDSEDVNIKPKAVAKKNLVSCTLIDMLKLNTLFQGKTKDLPAMIACEKVMQAHGKDVGKR